MTVHFVSPLYLLKKNTTINSLVLEFFKDRSNIKFDGNWINQYISESKYSPYTNGKFFKFHMEGIKSSDLVIMDLSVEDTLMGYYLRVATDLHIPVLVLSKKKRLEKELLKTLDSEIYFIHLKRTTIKAQLKKFFDGYKQTKDISSLQIQLNKKMNRYLHLKSIKKGVTKTNLIRQMIERDLREDS